MSSNTTVCTPVILPCLYFHEGNNSDNASVLLNSIWRVAVPFQNDNSFGVILKLKLNKQGTKDFGLKYLKLLPCLKKELHLSCYVSFTVRTCQCG